MFSVQIRQLNTCLLQIKYKILTLYSTADCISALQLGKHLYDAITTRWRTDYHCVYWGYARKELAHKTGCRTKMKELV